MGRWGWRVRWVGRGSGGIYLGGRFVRRGYRGLKGLEEKGRLQIFSISA